MFTAHCICIHGSNCTIFFYLFLHLPHALHRFVSLSLCVFLFRSFFLIFFHYSFRLSTKSLLNLSTKSVQGQILKHGYVFILMIFSPSSSASHSDSIIIIQFLLLFIIVVLLFVRILPAVFVIFRPRWKSTGGAYLNLNYC